MTLAFPNASRSFDRIRNAVRFFGHDGMFEIRFFVETAALIGTSAPPVSNPDEAEDRFLAAFDTKRTLIYAAARRAYSKGRASTNTLTVADVH